MHHPARRGRSWLLVGLSGGLLLQSTCFLDPEFDPVLLLAEVGSTLVTDAIFFALDSLLFSLA